jgi:hypothetical protein
VPPSGNSRIAVLLLTRGLHDHLAHVNVIRLLDAGWLQSRSTSFFDDRTKEVPNRLLERWAASRQKHGALTLDDLLEIAQLPDAKLDGAEMAEGARECWGLLGGATRLPHGANRRMHAVSFFGSMTSRPGLPGTATIWTR